MWCQGVGALPLEPFVSKGGDTGSLHSMLEINDPFYEFLPHSVESYDLVSPGIFKTSYGFKMLLLYACSLANQIIRAAGIPERSCIHIARVTPPRCGRDVLVRGES